MSINPPATITNILVNTLPSNKVVFLPAASTMRGHFYSIKDICGNAGISTIFVSTTGLDRLDTVSPWAQLSTNFGALTLASDGGINWMVLQHKILPQANLFTYSIFQGLTLAGNATYSGNFLQLTNTTMQGSSAYHPTKVPISGFETTFQVRFDSTQADGMAFVIQNASSNALGTLGFGLGYQGIGTSVAVRLDTYNGAGVPAGLGQFSTDILSNGSVPTDQGASGNLTSFFGLESNATWNFNARVRYDGSNLMYTLTNQYNISFTSNAAINIPQIVGGPTAWVGFTGGTGGAGQVSRVTGWTYRTISSFLPTHIANLTTWYDAADTTVFTGGATWTDKSGTGNTGTNGTPGTTNMPSVTTWSNGRRAARFLIASANSMRTTNTIPAFSVTYFMVFRYTAIGSGQQFLMINNVDGQRQLLTLSSAFPADIRFTTNSPNAVPIILSSAQNQEILVCMQVPSTTGGTANVFANGSISASATQTPLFSGTTASIHFFGSANGASAYSSVDMAEILIYSSILSTTNRQIIEGYLAWKWNLTGALPAAHPYKFSRP